MLGDRILGTPTFREWKEEESVKCIEKVQLNIYKENQKNVKECYEVESFKEKNAIRIVR